ncbi:MAG: GHKL domain-containing protein, partial [Chitinophagales bacterium]|nr:GHKL domain-containing protein [Chitinophagales bacterium]
MIDKVVDYFIPAKLQTHALHLRRSRVSVWINFVGIAYGLISLVIFYFANFQVGIVTATIQLAGLTCALFLFRMGVNKFIIGNFVSVVLIMAIGIFCFSTGGINSPGISLFALIPMITLMMVDRKAGLLWCFITSAAVLLFYILELAGFSFSELDDRNVRNYIFLSTSIGFIYLLFFIIRVAQHSEKKANKDLEEKNNELDNSFTELKDTQAMLVQAEKMASLGQLTAGLAHEINNPINFVSGNISPLKKNIDEIMRLLEIYISLNHNNYSAKLEEVLKYRNKIDLTLTIEEIKSLINGIEEGSRRTAEIVKGLRNFSRLDEEEMKKANINEGITSTLILLQNKLKHQNIEVVKSFGELPFIECYPGQLNQVFMNLFTNAIDAIGNNGKIFITTLINKSGDSVNISIRDTGSGITDEVKKKLFDPFFTTKEIGKGTGLGLSISYGIINKHNGKIDVISEVGKGTEFIITIPYNKTG